MSLKHYATVSWYVYYDTQLILSKSLVKFLEFIKIHCTNVWLPFQVLPLFYFMIINILRSTLIVSASRFVMFGLSSVWTLLVCWPWFSNSRTSSLLVLLSKVDSLFWPSFRSSCCIAWPASWRRNLLLSFTLTDFPNMLGIHKLKRINQWQIDLNNMLHCWWFKTQCGIQFIFVSLFKGEQHHICGPDFLCSGISATIVVSKVAEQWWAVLSRTLKSCFMIVILLIARPLRLDVFSLVNLESLFRGMERKCIAKNRQNWVVFFFSFCIFQHFFADALPSYFFSFPGYIISHQMITVLHQKWKKGIKTYYSKNDSWVVFINCIERIMAIFYPLPFLVDKLIFNEMKPFIAL